MNYSVMNFIKYTISWISQNLAIPFWSIGHIHLMTTVYQDIHEVIMSMGMNIIVAVGFIIDYKNQKNENSSRMVDRKIKY
jgi:hypothetical protein